MDQTYMIYLWIGIFIVSLLIEFLTADVVSIWFTAASIPAFILAMTNSHMFVQIAVFVLSATLLMIFTRPFVMKYFKTNEIKTNVDAFIGSTGVCLEQIKIGEIGKAKVRNQRWSAISNEQIEIGDNLRVLDIEGAKLIVEKLQ